MFSITTPRKLNTAYWAARDAKKKERQAVAMRCRQHGFTYKATGQALGVSVSRARQIYRRAFRAEHGRFPV